MTVYDIILNLQELLNDVLMAYLTSFNNDTSPSFEFCEYLNISVCPVSETNSVSINQPCAQIARFLSRDIDELQVQLYTVYYKL